MAKRKEIINLNDWYTAEEASTRLSQNSGREIPIDYPRTLARYGKVRSITIGSKGKLYHKEDINGYVVSTKRGRKPASQKSDEDEGDAA